MFCTFYRLSWERGSEGRKGERKRKGKGQKGTEGNGREGETKCIRVARVPTEMVVDC